MPKKAKVITDFREFPESELSDAVMIIINSLKANQKDFAELPVACTLLKSQLNKFNKVRLGVLFQGQTADTKKERKKLQRSLTNNGSTINSMYKGNVSALQKSGYPLHQPSKAQGILPKTVLTMIATRAIGKLKFAISIIRIQNVKYGIMYTLADNPEKDPSKWFFYYASKKTGTIPDLESRKEYKFVSFGMGSHRTLKYSNPVFMTAL